METTEQTIQKIKFNDDDVKTIKAFQKSIDKSHHFKDKIFIIDKQIVMTSGKVAIRFNAVDNYLDDGIYSIISYDKKFIILTKDNEDTGNFARNDVVKSTLLKLYNTKIDDTKRFDINFTETNGGITGGIILLYDLYQNVPSYKDIELLISLNENWLAGITTDNKMFSFKSTEYDVLAMRINTYRDNQ